MNQAKDSAGIVRTNSGSIDYDYYDQLARELRATYVTAVLSSVWSGICGVRLQNRPEKVTPNFNIASRGPLK